MADEVILDDPLDGGAVRLLLGGGRQRRKCASDDQGGKGRANKGHCHLRND
jgi:hypothetical protein